MAILLTIELAAFMLVSFALVLVGPTVAGTVAEWLHLGVAFAWIWKVPQWPLVFALVALGVALVYYVAPDVQQQWIWIVPGSVFADYQKTYGAIGGVIVALLWFYVSGLAILMGAEMNAVIEHGSPMEIDARGDALE